VEEPIDGRARRAAGRAGWPVERTTLGVSQADDLRATTTAEERLDMMWDLAQDAWAMHGRPTRAYTRSEAPGRLIRATDESR